MSTADQLIRQLCEFGKSAEVSITKQKSGWFVAVKPHDMAPLWWCASKPTLELALQSCKEQAVELGLIREEVDYEKELLKQTALYMASVTELYEVAKTAQEDFSGRETNCTLPADDHDHKSSAGAAKVVKFTVLDALTLAELLFKCSTERKAVLQKLGLEDTVYPKDTLWTLPTAWARYYIALHKAEKQFNMLNSAKQAYERSRKCNTKNREAEKDGSKERYTYTLEKPHNVER